VIGKEKSKGRLLKMKLDSVFIKNYLKSKFNGTYDISWNRNISNITEVFGSIEDWDICISGNNLIDHSFAFSIFCKKGSVDYIYCNETLDIYCNFKNNIISKKDIDKVISSVKILGDNIIKISDYDTVSKFYNSIPKFKEAGFNILHDSHDGNIVLSKDGEIFEIEYDYFHKNFIENNFIPAESDYNNVEGNIKIIYDILYPVSIK
jgi:hypothetical protein